MQSDIADTIYRRVKSMPIEKQREILRQMDEVGDEVPRTIWQRIRARSARISEKTWAEMPTDGSKQHDHHLYGTPKK